MITYYRDPQVLVTSQTLVVGGRSYPLGELAAVWHRRGQRSWSTVAGRGALGAAVLTPLVAAVVGIIVALSIRASGTVTIALVGGAVLVGLAAAPIADFVLEHVDRSYARGSRCLEIWAEVRGTPVLLLRTRDALRFGKIYRALQRALERTERPGVRSR